MQVVCQSLFEGKQYFFRLLGVFACLLFLLSPFFVSFLCRKVTRMLGIVKTLR